MARTAALLLAIVALLLGAEPASADWPLAGSGDLFARASELGAGSTPSGSASGRDVTVSWSSASGPAPPTGYTVTRYDTDGGGGEPAGATCAGPVAGLSCTEAGVPPGEWRYTVTPVRDNWHGDESAASAPVTVVAPSLTLAPTTIDVLPATLTGQIADYLQGQTVTFRLDDPTTGQTLSGTTDPTPVPSGGGADVTVTIPAATPDGPHTVYAIGDQGDLAAAAIDVEAGCPTPGDQVLAATRDTYVDSLSAGQSFGTQPNLDIGPAYLLLLAQQRALVGFDLPAIPEQCTLTAATLRLYATDPGAGRTIEAWRVDGTWTETTTWTNQPPTTGTPTTTPSLSTPGWQQWDVLNQIEAMYTDGNHGLLIKDTVNSGVLPPHQTYQSREGTPDTQDPQLLLTLE